MSANTFLICFTCFSVIYLGWGFIYLPRERWQILASIPLRRSGEGQWQGVNLTFYGFFTANAYLLALALMVLLLSSTGVSIPHLLSLALILLVVCVPASSLVARWVENKAHTFTVGGAVFVGILAAPWTILLLNHLLAPSAIPVLPALAALGIAYACGEGFGRLACISFGCCYGKALSSCNPVVQRIFKHFHLVFEGATKKISYAGHLDGQPVVPVQILTAGLYCLTAVVGTGLFLHAHYGQAFVLCGSVTQGWRIISEFLRADHRGELSFSAYQWMGLISVGYIGATAWLAPNAPISMPDVSTGIHALWNPLVIVSLQLVWWILFLYTGCSSVTGASMSFHVHQDRI